MPRDIPEHERPLNERYRLACERWTSVRQVWRELKEFKPVRLDELKLAVLQDARSEGRHITESVATREAQTSDAWKGYLKRLLDAEHSKNIAEAEKKALEMEQWERNDRNATAREERRSYRMGG